MRSLSPLRLGAVRAAAPEHREDRLRGAAMALAGGRNIVAVRSSLAGLREQRSDRSRLMGAPNMATVLDE
jgi:hypothetical protein